MIIEGSKIELVKEMGPFTNVGEVCEVVKVTEYGVISFKFGNGLHLGCMSYTEYETYFKPYGEQVNTIREWSEWSQCEITYIDKDSDICDTLIEARENGKKYQVKTVDFPVVLRAEAICSPDDEFNYTDGYNLAVARLRTKIAAWESKNLADSM
ncbi:hypothetical protein [Clostridium sp. HBUAS56010]|uniref:hypothetical protein n=1 Tax=Clostridium sp. HBUAS56010 TaxID=2571127 RepID=UPI001178076B|nr:hypothetical protein [Clostridium sp. HBUAS56010]